MFAACLSQGVVGGFFYSSGYYPFSHYTPTLPTTTHHLLPALAYSGCRNAHGAVVPCTLHTHYLTAVSAPTAAHAAVAAPVAAIEPVAKAPVEAAEEVAAVHDASTPELAVEATAERFIRTVSKYNDNAIFH